MITRKKTDFNARDLVRPNAVFSNELKQSANRSVVTITARPTLEKNAGIDHLPGPPQKCQHGFGIGAVTLVLANLMMRPILVALFEPNVAAAQGVPVRFVQYLLFALMVMSLVASLQAVGCVLSVGLLVTPAATVSLFTDRTAWLFWGGGLLGAVGAVLAVLLATPLHLTPGPAIVMVLGVLFIVGWLFSPKYGVLTRRKTI